MLKLKLYIAAMIAALLGALGIYAKGRTDATAKATAKADQSYIDKRKAADNADLGLMSTDAERRERLRQFADK